MEHIRRSSWPNESATTGVVAPPIPPRNPARLLAPLPHIQPTSADFTAEVTNALSEPSAFTARSGHRNSTDFDPYAYQTSPNDLRVRTPSPPATPPVAPRLNRPPQDHIYSIPEGRELSLLRVQESADNVFQTPQSQENGSCSLQRSASVGSRPARHASSETPRMEYATQRYPNPFTESEAARQVRPTHTRRNTASSSPVSRASSSATMRQRDSHTPLGVPGAPHLTSLRRSDISSPMSAQSMQHQAPTASERPRAGENDQCPTCHKDKPLHQNPLCCADPSDKVQRVCLECWQESLKMGLEGDSKSWMRCLHCGRELLLQECARLAKKRTLLK